MVSRISRKPVLIASSKDALSFVLGIQKQFAGRPLARMDRVALREQLAKVGAEELRGIARRILVDLVAPPVRPRGNAGQLPPHALAPARDGPPVTRTKAGKAATLKGEGRPARPAKKTTARVSEKPAKR